MADVLSPSWKRPVESGFMGQRASSAKRGMHLKLLGCRQPPAGALPHSWTGPSARRGQGCASIRLRSGSVDAAAVLVQVGHGWTTVQSRVEGDTCVVQRVPVCGRRVAPSRSIGGRRQRGPVSSSGWRGEVVRVWVGAGGERVRGLAAAIGRCACLKLAAATRRLPFGASAWTHGLSTVLHRGLLHCARGSIDSLCPLVSTCQTHTTRSAFAANRSSYRGCPPASPFRTLIKGLRAKEMRFVISHTSGLGPSCTEATSGPLVSRTSPDHRPQNHRTPHQPQPHTLCGLLLRP